MRYFRKDLNSPKYLFPKNLVKEHDRLVIKKRELLQRQEIQKKRERIENAQAEYERQKKLFFGLQFKAGGIIVRVLQSVQEFMEEGDVLKHCVFTNDYYNKKDSLVMSARIGNQPLETVEISLSKMKIIQARGMNNKSTDYHDAIVGLVNSNLHKIKAIVKKQKQAA